MSYQRDWEMLSKSHIFASSEALSTDARKILEALKEYDEICLQARAIMVEKINKIVGKKKPLK
jgi:hypothetical protein